MLPLSAQARQGRSGMTRLMLFSLLREADKFEGERGWSFSAAVATCCGESLASEQEVLLMGQSLEHAAGEVAAHGSPADSPGEPGVGPDVPCGLCGRPESRCQTLVCDGCDRGFHLSCIGLRARQVLRIDDWVCRECVHNGTGSQRWPLGMVFAGSKRSGVRILDMNASPPSDADCEGSDQLNGSGTEGNKDHLQA